MRFVLDECRDFFCVAHFGAAILVFSARFGAAFYCFNFAFCSSTHVCPLSHLSLLGFVTFIFFTLRCHLFFIFHTYLKNPVVEWLSILLPVVLLSVVQPPTFVGFFTFLYWVLSLSYFSHFVLTYFSYFALTVFLHELIRFLIVSFIPLT